MKIKAAALGSTIETFILPNGASLKDLLGKWEYLNKDVSIAVNGVKAQNFDVILKDGDIVTAACSVRAEAPPLLMKKFKKYLKKNGFRFYQQGKGDHEIWMNEKEIKISINPNKRDKRCVDWASFNALKNIVGLPQQELINAINNM